MKRSPSTLALKRLAGAQDRYDDARALREIAVRNARELGYSWDQIGCELLMSKQAAWQQFRHLDPTEE